MILRNKDAKLAKWKKMRKIGICILYTRWVVEMGDVTLVSNATLYECDQAQCGGVKGTMHKELLTTRDIEEYYTTAPQCETMHSRTLCWFVYFAASHVRWRLISLPSIKYRINVEVECYHCYNNCYVLIMRAVSLSSPYRHTRCFLESHPPHSLGIARISWLVTQA